MGWMVNATLRPLIHRELPDTYRTGGWVVTREGLDGYGKFHLHRHSIPGTSSP
jgi:hypothetical protein